MVNIATSIGIKSSDIITEPRPKDTKDEALFIKLIVQKSKFVLVTSAYHMDRAMGLFKSQGVDPVPDPTNYLTENSKGFRLTSLIPTFNKVKKVEVALHKTFGIIWAKFKGQL